MVFLPSRRDVRDQVLFLNNVRNWSIISCFQWLSYKGSSIESGSLVVENTLGLKFSFFDVVGIGFLFATYNLVDIGTIIKSNNLACWLMVFSSRINRPWNQFRVLIEV